jgi:hypothetical protein
VLLQIRHSCNSPAFCLSLHNYAVQCTVLISRSGLQLFKPNFKRTIPGKKHKNYFTTKRFLE